MKETIPSVLARIFGEIALGRQHGNPVYIVTVPYDAEGIRDALSTILPDVETGIVNDGAGKKIFLNRTQFNSSRHIAKLSRFNLSELADLSATRNAFIHEEKELPPSSIALKALHHFSGSPWIEDKRRKHHRYTTFHSIRNHHQAVTEANERVVGDIFFIDTHQRLCVSKDDVNRPALHEIKATRITPPTLAKHQRLSAALKELRLMSGLTPDQLAMKLNVFTESVKAYERGLAFPSTDILKKYEQHLTLDAQIASELQTLQEQEKSAMREKNPVRERLMTILGKTTMDSNPRAVWRELSNPSPMIGKRNPLSREKVLERTDMNISAFMRATSPSREYHYNHRSTPEIMAKGFLVGQDDRHSSLYPLFIAIGTQKKPRQPLGIILEEYITNGGKDFAEFFHTLMKEWKIAIGDFSKETGIPRPTIKSWLKTNGKRLGEQSLESISRHYGLSPDQQQLLWALGCGDIALGPMEKILQEAQRKIRSAHPETMPRTLFTKLTDYTGITPHKLGISADTFRDKRRGRYGFAHTDSTMAISSKLAFGNASQAKWINMLLNGIPEYSPLGRLLEKDWHEIIWVARVQRGLGIKEFAAAIPYHNPRTGERGVSNRTVSEWELGNNDYISPAIAPAVATFIGYRGKDRKRFLEKICSPDPELATTLDKYDSKPWEEARSGLLRDFVRKKISLAAFINTAAIKLGMTFEEFAEASGKSELRHQLNTQLSPEVAVAIAKIIGYGEEEKNTFLTSTAGREGRKASVLDRFGEIEDGNLPWEITNALKKKEITIGESLFVARTRREHTLGNTAEILGTSRDVVRDIENGNTYGGTVRLASAIADYVGSGEDKEVFIKAALHMRHTKHHASHSMRHGRF